MTDELALVVLSIACGIGAVALAALAVQMKRAICRGVIRVWSELLDGAAIEIE